MYKKFYAEKNIDIKEYIAIVISVLVIIISVVLIIGSLKRKNYILRAEEVRQEKLRKQEELKQSEVDKVKTAEEEKLEKIRAEDKRLGLTSTAQKERDNFIYNKNIQTDIDKIYSSDKKEVYLTFDDGPSKYTNAILDVLKEADVKATFFILAANIKGRENELRRIYNEGHTVANHSYSHVYANVYKTPESTYNEYIKAETELKKILGNDFNSNLFRFPGGSVGGYYEAQKKKSREYFTKKKIAFVDWNCLTDDSVGADTHKRQLEVFNRTKKNKKALVILQHDSSINLKTAGTTKLMIEQLKKEGYVFKNFNDILVKEDKTKDIENIIEKVENNNDINLTFI